jgi:hypothetical protein
VRAAFITLEAASWERGGGRVRPGCGVSVLFCVEVGEGDVLIRPKPIGPTCLPAIVVDILRASWRELYKSEERSETIVRAILFFGCVGSRLRFKCMLRRKIQI